MSKIGLLVALLLMLPVLMVISGEDACGGDSTITVEIDDLYFEYDKSKISVFIECESNTGNIVKINIKNYESISTNDYPDFVLYIEPRSIQYLIAINGVTVSEDYLITRHNLDEFEERVLITVENRPFELFCFENNSFSDKQSDVTIGSDFTFDYRPAINGHMGIWNTKSDGTGVDVILGVNIASEAMLDSAIQVNGEWGIPLYPKDVDAVTVNYDLCGGSGNISNGTAYCWNEYTIPEAAPVNDGFTFMYWTLDNEQYSPGTKIQIEKDTDYTFTAAWKMDHFDIDNCNVTVDGIKGGHASIVIEPKEHYEISFFNLISKDWNIDTKSNDKVAITTNMLDSKPEFDIEVTPVMYTLTLITNGGTVEGDWIEKIESNKYQRSFNMVSGNIQLPTPQKDGYTFVRWLDGDMTVKPLDGLEEDMTLTAEWMVVTSDGGSGETSESQGSQTSQDSGSGSESDIQDTDPSGSQGSQTSQSSGSGTESSTQSSGPSGSQGSQTSQDSGSESHSRVQRDEPDHQGSESDTSHEESQDADDAQEYIVKFYLNEYDSEPYDTVTVSNGFVNAPVPADIDGMEFVRWVVYADGEITEFDGKVSDDMIVQAEWKEKTESEGTAESSDQLSVEAIIIIIVASILGSAIALKIVMTFLRK